MSGCIQVACIGSFAKTQTEQIAQVQAYHHNTLRWWRWCAFILWGSLLNIDDSSFPKTRVLKINDTNSTGSFCKQKATNVLRIIFNSVSDMHYLSTSPAILNDFFIFACVSETKVRSRACKLRTKLKLEKLIEYRNQMENTFNINWKFLKWVYTG